MDVFKDLIQSVIDGEESKTMDFVKVALSKDF